MSTRGLIGFRKGEIDKLAYNHSGSEPDSLGLKILKELRDVKDWGAVRQRIDSLHNVPETRKLDEYSSIAETEIRRHSPDLKYSGTPKDIYGLYQPLQGTLKPYLEGKLTFMPDASDFIYDSLHCDWAYITNLDSGLLEVWKGSQLEPDSEDNRVVEEPNRYGHEADQMGYYPCAMVRDYDLQDLPNHGRFLTYYSFSEPRN